MRIVVRSPNAAIDIELDITTPEDLNVTSVSIDLKDATVAIETDKFKRPIYNHTPMIGNAWGETLTQP
jgi:hypothetical protein